MPLKTKEHKCGASSVMPVAKISCVTKKCETNTLPAIKEIIQFLKDILNLF